MQAKYVVFFFYQTKWIEATSYTTEPEAEDIDTDSKICRL